MPDPAEFNGASHNPCPLGTAGGQNLRDLGGYRTRSGRMVRMGQIFRSGSMHFLTRDDHALLQSYAIRTVCDLRTNPEREREPVAWPTTSTPRIVSGDIGRDISIAPTEQIPSFEEAQAIMAGLYGSLLDDLNPQYRGLFAELRAGHAPLLFNCTAGKDRTGIAAALVLTALDVPRDTVVADYLLTNRYYDPARSLRVAQHADKWRHVPAAVLQAYRMASPLYIQTIFDRIDTHDGGEAGFFHDQLGMGEADIGALRADYTE